MLTIGEFSNICKVSTKTLRYYAEIGLIEPSEVNPENGYRYYAIEQLEGNNTDADLLERGINQLTATDNIEKLDVKSLEEMITDFLQSYCFLTENWL